MECMLFPSWRATCKLPSLALPSRKGQRRALPLFVRSAATGPTLEDLKVSDKTDRDANILACPICYRGFEKSADSNVSWDRSSSPNSRDYCGSCRKSYSNEGPFRNLVVAGDTKDYDESRPIFSEIFRSPIVSFLYERGWRQNFVWGGFPGPDEEFEMAKEYLRPTMGRTIIDASCGSGLFSRRFAKSGLYSLVFALDYSENMLRQCADFNKEAGILADESFVLVRADISRLPFLTSSVDAIHAGAALHSWPSPSTAVAEISRVLRPGGVFVATTFILDNFFLPTLVHRVLRQYIGQFFQYYSSERELEDLCTACGLVGFQCQRRGQFIMLSATKPLH